MITTITLSPCLDFTVSLEALQRGTLNLAQDSRTDVSGKGINVSAVLNELGAETFATGISFQENHSLLERFLGEKEIPHLFSIAPGEIRTNIKLIEADGAHTEINSVGQRVGEQELREVSQILQHVGPKSKAFVFSGRIPNGVPESIYRTFIKFVRNFGVPIALDTSDKALLLGAQQKPTLLKPNLREFLELSETTETSVEAISKESRRLASQLEVEYICVSLGEQGAVLSSRDTSLFAPAPQITVKSPTGAGDSMLAGLLYALTGGFSMEQMLIYGVACASATVQREGTLLGTKKEIATLLPKVSVHKLKN